jgi:hypothetical protein
MSNLYYMAPLGNAATIAAFGILSYNTIHANGDLDAVVQNIADPFVNSRRHRRMIDGRSLHDYVPLYWATHTPMQYVVTFHQNLPQEQLIFFVLDSDRVLELPRVWTTDGNAASNETTFYEGAGAIEHLDWRVLRTPNCYSPEYRRKKCAEVLVPDHVSQELITAIHTVDNSVASDFRELLRRLATHRDFVLPMIERVSANSALYYR